jgi:AmmeMemoRadiSam system protein A
MLQLARKTLEAELSSEPLPSVEPYGCQDVAHSGAFVTLKNEGRLRGCIGTFSPSGTLPETIREMTVASSKDPRFFDDMITAAELDQLEIQISVLSPLERTSDPLSLELGEHGIYIVSGARTGCFLPQVATEVGWSKEEFLSHCCCDKAGLAADAWRNPDTEVHLFTAEVFGEEPQD